VRALARAAGYGAWRAAPRGHRPRPPDVRTADARALIRESAPGWLGTGQAAELLRCYGIGAGRPASAGPRVVVRVAGDRVFGPLVRLEAAIHTERPVYTPSPTSTPAYLTRERPDLDLVDLLLRVSRLADDLPEVTELELGPGRRGRDRRPGSRRSRTSRRIPYLRKLR